MLDKEENKENWKLILLSCTVYFTSYLTRMNYAASLEEIIQSMSVTGSVAGMALTGSFITYGVGQLVSGFLGDRIQPRILITAGLCTTSLCNLAVAFLENLYVISVVWFINGFAQAFLWPPLLRTMSDNLTLDRYKQGCALVTSASALATMFVYILVPICIAIASWRLTFVICAIVGLGVSALWFACTKSIRFPIVQENMQNTKEKPLSIIKLIRTAGLIPIGFVIILHGILKDGITTWMPSYINSTFHLGSSISILIGAILPIFNVISVIIANKVLTKTKTELVASLYAWCIAAVASLLLVFTFDSQILVSILMMALIIASMYGVNLMLISNLPIRFQDYSRVSLISGILNFSGYIGSALSVYGIAKISGSFGWKTTILLWFAITVLGISLCGVSIKTNKAISVQR